MTSADVLDGVRAVIRKIMSDSTLPLGPEVRLIQDLRLSSDDLSFLFAPDIERQFGIKPSLEAWRGVRTIEDTVQLVERHRSHQRSMTRLSRLSATDLETVRRALNAAVDGPFFPEWEFPILLPIDRGGVQQVLEQWPKAIEDPFTEEVALSVLNNLCGYPHQHDDQLVQWTGCTKDELRDLFRALRQS